MGTKSQGRLNMRHARAVILVVLGVLASGCVHYGGPPTTSLSKLEELAADGTYVHEPSGMSFPVTVGVFVREKVKKYDTEGLDISVGYNLYLPPRLLAATVYVYPSPPCSSLGGSDSAIQSMKESLAGDEFERRKAEILRGHPGASLVSEGDFEFTRQGTAWTGRKATFQYVDSLAHRRQPLTSELYLFCYVGERWTVKYRFTHPAGGPEAEGIETFLKDFHWSIPMQ